MRYYSSNAVSTALTAAVTNSATSMNVGSVTGFPVQYPYTLSIDADNANKELVEVTAAVGTTLTVVRGRDGTAGVSHTLGAKVSHDHSARDFRESREHEAAASGVHGVAGNVVGTTDTQTLTNKDLSTGNTFPGSLATDAELSAAVAPLATTAALTAHTSNTSNPHSVTKAQVGLGNADNTSDANKPISTLVGAALTLKQNANTAATLTDTQTLTNKTLSTGTKFASPRLPLAVNAGGTLVDGAIPIIVDTYAGLPATAGYGTLAVVRLDDADRGRLFFYDNAIGWIPLGPQSGSGTSGTVTQSVAKTISVTFPVPFTQTPHVVISYRGTNPDTRFVCVNNLSSLGFDAICVNTASTSSVPFEWIATAR